MTDGALERGAREAARGFYVTGLRDRRAIEAHLSDDRAFAAYALGHLEPELFAHAEYWAAEGPSGPAVVMHARALGPVTVTVGDPDAVAAILSLHPGMRLGYLSTAAPEHVRVLGRTHIVTDALHMMRMSVNPVTFEDAAGHVRRLRGHDVMRLNDLYAADSAPTRYGAETIERAIYYGAFEGDRLASVAGTHVVSPAQSIAVVGNVLTHPAHRGRGLATRVTAAVTRELLARGCSEIVLTVDPENAPAVAAYSRLGYRRGSAVVEARLQRRDLFGLTPLWRRVAARRRGRPAGDSIEWVRARDGRGRERPGDPR
ncbi:MAG: GNAT family N-acetyltransferase [Dehalococcoidia bacterium]